MGSILPGIVLSTRTIPPNLTFGTLTVPDLFTIAPTYLPDAPFVNRLYGESSFTNMVVGAKIRLTGPNNAFGFGFIPFYRWYLDKANDFSGFNQMQRGAGPGADIGDFGLVMFADGRLSEHVNVSANLGYILNSNPKSEAMGDAVLLDRPDEFLAGVGFDFPVNKHFQAIAELRSTMYVGGRTPNAFPNNPVDALGGIRIFPARWWGIGAAYRRASESAGRSALRQRSAECASGLRMIRMDSSSSSGLVIAIREDCRRRLMRRRRFRSRRPCRPSHLPCPPGTSSDDLYAERVTLGGVDRQRNGSGQRHVALYVVSNRWKNYRRRPSG